MLIKEVSHNSIAERIGIRAGEDLVAINGRSLRDVIDYRYYSTDEKITLTVGVPDGATRDLIVNKHPDEDLGLTLTENKIQVCKNNCPFCFVYQLPKGLRRTLYIKDDDYRLSFLHGDFITLTNLKEEDFQRIIEQRLSPLYVSVHTTNEELRKIVLGNPKSPPLGPALLRLLENGIKVHTQIVLCPGLNDGVHLDRSIQNLAGHYPGILSVAVVPVGLTKFRNHLPFVKPVDPDYCRHYLKIIAGYRKQLKEKLGIHFVYAADEFFTITGETIPSTAYYENFPQIENGVGMVRWFLDDFQQKQKMLPGGLPEPLKVLMATGDSAGPIMRKEIIPPLARIKNFTCDLLVVKNYFFGTSVTVSGLLTGRDIIDQVNARAQRYDYLIVPPNCVNQDSLFLDNRSLEEVNVQTDLRAIGSQPSLIDTLRVIFQSGKRNNAD